MSKMETISVDLVLSVLKRSEAPQHDNYSRCCYCDKPCNVSCAQAASVELRARNVLYFR